MWLLAKLMHSHLLPLKKMSSGYPHPPPPGSGAWTTGLCGCFSDCKSCCLSFFCPCIPFGQVAEVLDKGVTSCGLAGLIYCLLLHAGGLLLPCHCLYTCTYRRKLRATYGLPPEPCGDCCVHFWCGPCALSQMYRELKNRGADPADGWEVLSQKMTTAPVPMQDMTR